MRKGDPEIASSSKTWTQINKPFASPVTRNVAGLNQGDAPKTIPPAAHDANGAVAENQRVTGDFNIANGGSLGNTKPNF